MFSLKVFNKFSLYLTKSASYLNANNAKTLSKTLGLVSNKNYSTSVPIDDEIFGFTDDQKQVSAYKCDNILSYF